MVKNNVNLMTVFPKQLQKKISKTEEARTGKGIYKRRNNRNYRVIMHLSTYRRIIAENPNILNEFKNGYAVRVSPEEYFENGEVLPSGLVLGKNAFIYYKTISSYRKYEPKPEWNEIIELVTSNQTKPTSLTQEWIGEYATFINNTKPPIVSNICKTNNSLSKDFIEELKNKYGLDKIPSQAGLGNFDYDYASKNESLKIKYQLSYFILNVKGMDEYLYELCKDDIVERVNEFSSQAYIAAAKGKEAFFELYQDTLKYIEDFCIQNGLLDFQKLEEIRAWDKHNHEPVCPLCLESLSAADFLEVESQAVGREEEDNTRSKIALMHINALRPGELNHRTYNLGWGHRHCNQIQEDMDIETTISILRQIIKNNDRKLSKQ